VGLGTCLFVRDYLPVRGISVVLLLAAKLTVDSARWLDTPWRLVMVILAYVWVIGGMWFTISPWRLRDLIQWVTATNDRVRLVSAIRLGFGIVIILLGLTVYRGAERPAVASAAVGLNRPLYRSTLSSSGINPCSAGLQPPVSPASFHPPRRSADHRFIRSQTRREIAHPETFLRRYSGVCSLSESTPREADRFLT
jgi:hypothetical protein